jgi:hypothetical protein
VEYCQLPHVIPHIHQALYLRLEDTQFDRHPAKIS